MNCNYVNYRLIKLPPNQGTYLREAIFIQLTLVPANVLVVHPHADGADPGRAPQK